MPKVILILPGLFWLSTFAFESTSYQQSHNRDVRAPSCELKATPFEGVLGDPVVLTLRTTGHVWVAKVNDQRVATPVGTLIVSPQSTGTYQAEGKVRGIGGSNHCEAMYKVNPKN